MSLYRRAQSPYWWINIYRPRQKPLQVCSQQRDRDAAAAIEATLRLAQGGKTPAEKLHALIDQLAGETRPGTPLTQVWPLYESVIDATSLAPRTLRSRRDRLRELTVWMATHWPKVRTMQEVSRAVAFGYADSWRDRGSPKTWANIRGDLSAIWSACLARAELAENVWRLTPTRGTRGEHGRAFAPAEVAAILGVAKEPGWPGDWYGICLTALYTGLRLGDVLALPWTALQDGLLDWQPAKTRRHGTRVAIPLHPALARYLEAKRAAGAPAGPIFAGARVFEARPGTRGEKRVVFSEILRRAGIDRTGHVTFHCWRHTFRTRLAEAGVSGDVARKLGGWTSPAMDARYDHDLTQARAAIARLA